MEDHPSVNIMWNDYLATIQEGEDQTDKSYTAWHFELNEESAEKLANLVMAGKKRATASCLWALEADGDEVPKPGDLSIITGWDGTARCVIQTTCVEIVPFHAVSPAFALREGEGNGSLAYWRRVHVPFFTAECRRIGRVFTKDMPVVCEDFTVVFPKDAADG